MSRIAQLGPALLRRLSPSYHRFHRFVRRRQTLATAPYALTAYVGLLDLIAQSQGERLCDFNETSVGKGERAWFVRHDLDEPSCLVNAPALIRLALQRGVRPGVFIRVHSGCYRPEDARSLLTEFSCEGVVFGLHSECYLSDDWLQRLMKEVDSYRSALGVNPFAVNAHGYGSYRLNVRHEFYRGMTPERMEHLGIRLNDCGSGSRRYGYHIQDCHSTRGSASVEDIAFRDRCILSDFQMLPPRGWVTTGLILTHPCYWMLPERG